MTTPAWIGATTGQPPLAAQINQFLGTHATTYIYTGVTLGGATVLGSGSVTSNGLYVAQAFTPGSSQSPGRFVFSMSVTGSPSPLTVSIQTSSGSAPSGTALVSTTIPAQWMPGTQTLVSVPLPCSLTASTTYWAVFNAVGDASDYYSLYKSNQTSGVSTSTNGTSWASQTYGIYYARYDQSAVLPLVHTWTDSGARWTTVASNTGNQPTNLQEYTVAQGSGQYVYSNRAFTYSGTSLISAT